MIEACLDVAVLVLGGNVTTQRTEHDVTIQPVLA